MPSHQDIHRPHLGSWIGCVAVDEGEDWLVSKWVFFFLFFLGGGGCVGSKCFLLVGSLKNSFLAVWLDFFETAVEKYKYFASQ